MRAPLRRSVAVGADAPGVDGEGRRGRRRRERPLPAGALGRGAGRVALWAFVAVVLVRGLGAILSGPSSDHATHDSIAARTGASFPDDEARALATRFASVYLDVSPKRPKAHRQQVSAYVTEGLGDQAGAVLPSHGSGMSVALATVAREVSLSDSRALITVATTSTTGTVRYLTVPVGRDRAGALAVVGLPSLAPPPAKSSEAVAQPVALSGPDAAPIRDLAGRFLSAYLGGQGRSTLGYFLAPGARIVQMPAGLRVRSVGQVSRDPSQPRLANGGVAVLVVVRVQDAETGVVYPLGYRLEVVRRDRWYVAAVSGGPSS